MICLDKNDLSSQAGMERAFRSYFEQAAREFPGTFNVMMDTKFESCDYGQKSLILRMELAPWMANPGGILHGGVTASVMDLTMGLLCRYFGGGAMTPTVSMEVSYLNAGAIGKSLLVRADVTKCGFTLCHATSTAWMEGAENAPVCTAAGVYYVSRKSIGAK